MYNIDSNSVLYISYHLDVFINFICYIVVYYCSFRNAKIYVKILRDIAFCWADLSHVNVDSILKYLHRLLLYPAIVWLVVFPIDQVIAIITGGVENACISVIIYSFTEIIIVSVVAFHCVMVLLSVGLLKNIEKHCQIVVETNHKRTRNLGNVNRSVEVDYWVHIGQLERAYEKTIQITKEINNALQAPILVIIIQCFLSILIHSLSLSHMVRFTMRIDSYLIVQPSLIVLYSLSKVYVLTFTGSLLKGEEFNIGQTLHNIPTENQDNIMLIEIQHFATLMSFHKPIITVYDYFSLDATFLYGMIATVVTYLVILIQFD